MPLYNDTALVLRHYDLAESDRIVSFFGRRYGRIRVVAKGAKKLKSRFAGRLEPFHSLDIVFFGKENANLVKLSSVEMSTSRTGISADLEKFYHASYMVEMVEAGLREGDPNLTAFDLVAKGLSWLERQTGSKDLEWVTRFFDLKFLSALGYRPMLERCLLCKKEWSGDTDPFFDPLAGGLLCRRCSDKKTGFIPLSKGAAKFLGKILITDFEMAERLKPSQSLLEEISRSILAFRNARLQKVFKTERFLA